jgi:lipopolysaccharide assembly outer membrane protein LptD (OstA)
MPKVCKFIISALTPLLLSYYISVAQNNTTSQAPGLPPTTATDSLKTDSIPAKKNRNFITSEVTYNATDSIISSLDDKKVYLYKNAIVKYQDIELTAWFIELDLKNNEAYACGTKDSLNKETGLPVFKDKSSSYTMRTMRYNFETKKAIIEHVVTEQGEGYIVSDVAKKTNDNEFCMKGGMYTTCDIHDHPHFGLKMTKAKVIPGKKIVTGPAYLIIEDIPFYFIGIPFGFVPSTSKYSSGFVMPSYGEESSRGFFLRDGGYYWAANDYFDLSLTGDIYTNGSWGLRGASSYRNRYKYSGNISAQFINNQSGEKDLPDFTKSKDFSLTWSHRQDSKASLYHTFSASVNYSTSAFDRRNVTSVINPNILANNTKRSSISYSKRWPKGPFNFSANLLHSQNSRDTSIDLTLPDVTLTMNRIYPFKSKNKIGSNERWYEKISLSYSGNMKNYISTKESELMESSFNTDWKNGIRHSVPISMNLKFLKYFTTSPSFNYTERWYFSSIKKGYDKTTGKIVNTDTTSGFYRVYDYNYSIGTSTKLYTFYTPSRKIFGDKINTIRHVMTPSISMSYNPDFSQAKYGFYDSFEYYDVTADEVMEQKYSKFENGIFGSPSSYRSGSMGFSLGNTLDMKVKSLEDSTGFKKISIIESLNFSSGYNFLADSLKFNKISMSGRTKIFKTDISFGASFDPYALDTTKKGSVIRVNESIFNASGHQKLLRLESANMSFGMSFNNETFKKKQTGNKNENEQPEGMDNNEMPQPEGEGMSPNSSGNNGNLELGEGGYAKFKIPWNVSINFNARIIQGSFSKQKMDYNRELTSDITLNGSISPTPKWSISFSSGYSLKSKELAHTNFNIRRNLHCWSMSMNLVPIGPYKSYLFNISANSSMLKDLKYEKRNSPSYTY